MLQGRLVFCLELLWNFRKALVKCIQQQGPSLWGMSHRLQHVSLMSRNLCKQAMQLKIYSSYRQRKVCLSYSSVRPGKTNLKEIKASFKIENVSYQLKLLTDCEESGGNQKQQTLHSPDTVDHRAVCCLL